MKFKTLSQPDKRKTTIIIAILFIGILAAIGFIFNRASQDIRERAEGPACGEAFCEWNEIVGAKDYIVTIEQFKNNTWESILYTKDGRLRAKFQSETDARYRCIVKVIYDIGYESCPIISDEDDQVCSIEGSPSPSPTPSASPTPSGPPTPSASVTPTATPTATPHPSASPTPSGQPSATPIPSATPRPTNTPVPSATPIPNPSASPAPSGQPGQPGQPVAPNPSATPRPTNTPVPSATPNPTSTPTPTKKLIVNLNSPTPQPEAPQNGVNPSPTPYPTLPRAGKLPENLAFIGGILLAVILIIAGFAL